MVLTRRGEEVIRERAEGAEPQPYGFPTAVWTEVIHRDLQSFASAARLDVFLPGWRSIEPVTSGIEPVYDGPERVTRWTRGPHGIGPWRKETCRVVREGEYQALRAEALCFERQLRREREEADDHQFTGIMPILAEAERREPRRLHYPVSGPMPPSSWSFVSEPEPDDRNCAVQTTRLGEDGPHDTSEWLASAVGDEDYFDDEDFHPVDGPEAALRAQEDDGHQEDE